MDAHSADTCARTWRRRSRSPLRGIILPPPASSSSLSQDDGVSGGRGYVLRENPRKSFRLVDPEFSFSIAADGGDVGASGSSVVVQDRESETDSPIGVKPVEGFCRRPKRRRSAALDAEMANSVSDTTPEEEVASWLVMLSQDKWFKSPINRHLSDGSNFDDDEEDDDLLAVRSRRSRYQCGTCKKVFRSYQALGGHRASHKKETGACFLTTQIHQIPSNAAAPTPKVNAGKIHECPVCFRIFSSGQGLGGHKRSHLSGAAMSSSPPSIPPPPGPPPSSTNFAGACNLSGEIFIVLNHSAPAAEDVGFSPSPTPSSLARYPPSKPSKRSKPNRQNHVRVD